MSGADGTRGERRVHLITQYLWPTAVPCGIYAEELADRLRADGYDVVLVWAGTEYRRTERPAPATPIITLPSYKGRRGSHLSVLRGYFSVAAAFRDYIREHVQRGDLVIVTSGPPPSVRLHRAIHERGATAFFWLQDYYPELIRGVWDYPKPLRAWLGGYWHRHMAQWDRVVKCATNLDYHGANAMVIRNWATLEFPEAVTPEPKTALYTGNFGYGHDVECFVAECAKLRDRGYRITVRGDGPGMKKLPDWIDAGPPYATVGELHEALQRHEIHLVAAHPKIRGAIFPSKIWNSLAAGREVIGSGFEREMADELEATRRAQFREHRAQWEQLVAEAMGKASQPV